MATVIDVVNTKGKAGEYKVKIPEGLDLNKASIGAIVNEDGIKVSVLMFNDVEKDRGWYDITNKTIACIKNYPNLIDFDGYCVVNVSNDFTKDIIIYFTTEAQPQQQPQIK